MERQQTIGLHAFMCGFLCLDWVSLQSIYLQQTGLKQYAKRWATQLIGKLIDIIFNIWDHRNEVLHKKDNNIKEQKHEEMNRTIEQLFSDLPNMRLFTQAEQRFNNTTIQQIQEQNIHRKGQWIKKAQSIMNTFK